MGEGTMTAYRYGIAFKDNKRPALPYQWKWYWRCGLALTCLFLSGFLALFFSNNHQTAEAWLAVGFGIIGTFTIVPELLVLSILFLVLYIPYKVLGALFPESSWGDWAPYMSIAFAAYVAFRLEKIHADLKAVQARQAHTASLISSMWVAQDDNDGMKW